MSNSSTKTNISDTSSTSAIADTGPCSDGLRLLPPAAHRPPGTFHLTLGTMDLSDEEDMNLAIKLLDQIGYLDLLRAAEAGELAEPTNPSRKGRSEQGNRARGEAAPAAQGVSAQSKSEPETAARSSLQSLTREITPPQVGGPPDARRSLVQSTQETRTGAHSSSPSSLPAPLSITLYGLGTFPEAKASRVFYARPYDATSRLLPFGKAVRRIFQEAGLITETRPLVLHATVANMIYVKDRSRGFRVKGKGRSRGGQAGTVDARDILRFFNDGPAVDAQGGNRQLASPSLLGSVSGFASTTTTSTSTTEADTSSSPDTLGPPVNLMSTSSSPSGSDPETHKQFIWARDIQIDRIRICKMGAEPADIEGWGMEYKPIAEKVFFL